MLPLLLNAPVGFGHDNGEDDVKAMATNLSWLGYPEAEAAAESGRWDGGAEDGLRQYQRERGLTVDGCAGPGGETERALNGDLPRADDEREADATLGAGGFERLRDRLRPAAMGRTQPRAGPLDIDAPPRANPFAAARAFCA